MGWCSYFYVKVSTMEQISLKSRKMLMIAGVALLVAASGVIEITPVGTDLRFSVASIILIFSLLVIRSLPPIAAGLSSAAAIFVLRVILDYYFRYPEAGLAAIAWVQFPGALYYLLVGLFIYLFRVQQRLDNLAAVVILTIIADVSANLVELFIRDGFAAMHLRALGMLLAVSALRVIWVASVVALIWIRQLQARQQEERQHLDKTIIMLSGLHTEAFFLRKTFKEMEEIMKNCYKIYHSLANRGVVKTISGESAVAEDSAVVEESSRLALQVSHKAHEIKKDFQRTLAGLEKFVQSEHSRNYMTITELVRMVIRSHENYARNMGKNILFVENIETRLYTGQIYPLTSILTNLVINALEAIPAEGKIEIKAREKEGWLDIKVADNGPGIPGKKVERIFDLGYTTKFTVEGKPYTGIGLNHVSELAEKLGGFVEVAPSSGLNDGGNGAAFRVRVPLSGIAAGGEKKNGPFYFLYS